MIDHAYKAQKYDFIDYYLYYIKKYNEEPTRIETQKHINNIVNIRQKYGRYILHIVNDKSKPLDLKYFSIHVLYFNKSSKIVPISKDTYYRVRKKKTKLIYFLHKT